MLGYLATAMLACSFGFVLGGLIAGNRSASLYERLAASERKLAAQAAIVETLASSVSFLVDAAEGRAATGEAEAEARLMLASCEDQIAELRGSAVAASKREF